jgi:hypothetical protein
MTESAVAAVPVQAVTVTSDAAPAAANTKSAMLNKVLPSVGCTLMQQPWWS